MATLENSTIKTKVLIISDTHALDLKDKITDQPVDVAIHCGDLTEESKLAEYRTTLELLESINAPLKLVIAGNHDFTLDTPIYEAKIKESVRIGNVTADEIMTESGQPGEARTLNADERMDEIIAELIYETKINKIKESIRIGNITADEIMAKFNKPEEGRSLTADEIMDEIIAEFDKPEEASTLTAEERMDEIIAELEKHEEAKALTADEIMAEYGKPEEARTLLLSAKAKGIHLLDEGTHRFTLANGASLTVYASPFTPVWHEPDALSWGFPYQSSKGHDFAIEPDTDIVITHGPPQGIMDRTIHQQRAGCADLFAAVARARPRLHCFGHIHEGWGAKLVTWRDPISETRLHLTDIDNDKSVIIESLATISDGKFDTPELARQKREQVQRFREQRCCSTTLCRGNESLLEEGKQTVFVNAAIKSASDSEGDTQFAWVIDLGLRRASRKPGEADGSGEVFTGGLRPACNSARSHTIVGA